MMCHVWIPLSLSWVRFAQLFELVGLCLLVKIGFFGHFIKCFLVLPSFSSSRTLSSIFCSNHTCPWISVVVVVVFQSISSPLFRVSNLYFSVFWFTILSSISYILLLRLSPEFLCWSLYFQSSHSYFVFYISCFFAEIFYFFFICFKCGHNCLLKHFYDGHFKIFVG